MRFRLRTLLIVLTVGPIPLAALSANFLTLPLRESDRVEAARQLVAWIVENQPMPGFNEAYSDPQWAVDAKHFVVVCDYLSTDARVSDNARVERITRIEFDKMERTIGIDNGISIEPTNNSTQMLKLNVNCVGGQHHSRGFEFEFRRKVWGLRSAKISWSVPLSL